MVAQATILLDPIVAIHIHENCVHCIAGRCSYATAKLTSNHEIMK